LIKSKSEQHDTILLLHMSLTNRPLERQAGALQNSARYRKIFLDRDIEMQETLSWGVLLPQAYGLIRKTFPLPLGTYARVVGCAD
jgi:hypothetical protein